MVPIESYVGPNVYLKLVSFRQRDELTSVISRKFHCVKKVARFSFDFNKLRFVHNLYV